MAASYRSVRLDPAKMNLVLRSPRGEVGRYLSRLGGFTTREAKTLTAQRLTRRSGAYGDGFRSTTLRHGPELRLRITNSADHATFLENGTRPHLILPVRGRYLVFTGRDGTLVFARRVNHPGTQPYHILRDALRIGIRRAR